MNGFSVLADFSVLILLHYKLISCCNAKFYIFNFNSSTPALVKLLFELHGIRTDDLDVFNSDETYFAYILDFSIWFLSGSRSL